MRTKAEYTREIEALNAAHDATKAEYTREIEALNAAHGATKEKHAREIEALNAAHGTAKRRMPARSRRSMRRTQSPRPPPVQSSMPRWRSRGSS